MQVFQLSHAVGVISICVGARNPVGRADMPCRYAGLPRYSLGIVVSGVMLCLRRARVAVDKRFEGSSCRSCQAGSNLKLDICEQPPSLADTRERQPSENLENVPLHYLQVSGFSVEELPCCRMGHGRRSCFTGHPGPWPCIRSSQGR